MVPGLLLLILLMANCTVVSAYNTVSVIDSSTNQVVGKPIPVGTNPIGIAFNPASGKLYVSSINDNMISVISSQINSVIGNPIPVGIFPENFAFNPVNGNLYISNLGSRTVSVVSTVSLPIKGTDSPK